MLKVWQWGHWHSDNFYDGKLKPNTPSRDSKEDNANSGAVTFNMVHAGQSSETSDMKDISFHVGPLLDDSALYSRMGENEFHLLRSKLNTNFSRYFYELPETIPHRPYWQYGIGSHCSQQKRIIESVLNDL